MVKTRPQGVSKEDIVSMKSQILTTDWVPEMQQQLRCLVLQLKIEYIPIAHKMGLGNMNLESLNIKKI